MRQARRALLLAMLALPGCVTNRLMALSSPDLPAHGGPRGCTDAAASMAGMRWWRCLGDPPLSALIALAVAPTPAQPARKDLTVAIADRYIALRAAQTKLVLLAVREDIDGRELAMARTGGSAARRSVAAAEVQLARTRDDQARTRDEITALRERLGVLTGSTLSSMTEGPIPLPPPIVVDRASIAPAYAAARIAADRAQAQALAARACAALQAVHSPTTSATLAADRRALDALRAEEQARAALSLAYVALTAGPRTPGR